jgi:hypothetical protein
MLAKVLDWYRRWVLLRDIRYRNVVSILDEFDGRGAANDGAVSNAGERSCPDEADV